MQGELTARSTGAPLAYRNAFHCFYRTAMDEGLRGIQRGLFAGVVTIALVFTPSGRCLSHRPLVARYIVRRMICLINFRLPNHFELFIAVESLTSSHTIHNLCGNASAMCLSWKQKNDVTVPIGMVYQVVMNGTRLGMFHPISDALGARNPGKSEAAVFGMACRVSFCELGSGLC